LVWRDRPLVGGLISREEAVKKTGRREEKNEIIL
jgi:hypothetical protein